MDNSEIQKDEYYLPGGLGEVKVASTDKIYNVLKVVENKQNGSVAITVYPQDQELHNFRGLIDTVATPDEPPIEDAEFTIIEPKQLPEK